MIKNLQASRKDVGSIVQPNRKAKTRVMGKFLRRVAALAFFLILLEVVQKTVVLHHLLTFENQREDGWFPGQGPVLKKSTNDGEALASTFVSNPCQISPSNGGTKDCIDLISIRQMFPMLNTLFQSKAKWDFKL